MHIASRSVAFLLFATIVVAGCSSYSQSPASPSAGGGDTNITTAQLAGTWTLASMQPAGENEQLVPAGAAYTLTLTVSRVSTKADCNVCGGSLTVDGQTVTIGPLLACTLAACSTMAFENRYVAILAGNSTSQIDGTSLTLTSSRGTLRFHR